MLGVITGLVNRVFFRFFSSGILASEPSGPTAYETLVGIRPLPELLYHGQ